MNGIYGAVSLGNGGSTVLADPSALSGVLTKSQPGVVDHLSLRLLVDQPGVNIGMREHEAPASTAHVLESTDGDSLAVVVGDDSSSGHALREFLEDADPERLSGYFSALHIVGLKRRDRFRCRLIRDRSGSRTIAWRIHQGCLFFSPQPSTLAFEQRGLNDLDPVGLSFFLSTGSFQFGHTLFEHTRLVDASHLLDVDQRGNYKNTRYWLYPPAPGGHTRGLGEDATIRRGIGCLEDAVSTCFGDGLRPVFFLSGGWDSRGLVATAVKLYGGSSIDTVSWGLTEDLPDSDAYVARQLSERWGTNHHFIPKNLDVEEFEVDFGLACRMTDWQSSVAAGYPSEWRIASQLRHDGFNRCIRGDQTFPASRDVFSQLDMLTHAYVFTMLRQPLLVSVMCPEIIENWRPRIESAISNKLPVVSGYDYSDLRDLIRFEQHVGYCLHAASLYKQAFLDHRNAIADDSMLNFIACVDRPGRRNKQIYKEIVRHLAGPVADIGIANLDSDPDRARFFSAGGLATGLLSQALDDRHSGIYEFFDRPAVMSLAGRLRGERFVAKNSSGAALREVLRRQIKPRVLDTLLKLNPSYFGNLSAESRHRGLQGWEIMERFLVLKHFIDVNIR